MPMPPAVRDALARYRERLEVSFTGRILRITLFGSVARGDGDEESDVDVLVIVDRLGPGERSRVIDEGGRVAFDVGLPIIPLVLDEREWSVLVARERLLPSEVARDGIEA